MVECENMNPTKAKQDCQENDCDFFIKSKDNSDRKISDHQSKNECLEDEFDRILRGADDHEAVTHFQ